MYLLNERIKCEGRSSRVEIFPFFDAHIGKRNCAEDAIRKQLKEIIRRSRMPNRHVRVLFGGDQLNMIHPADLRRFDFAELADWFLDSDAETTRERLGDMVNQEINHAVEVFDPVRHLVLGAISGQHEKSMRTRQNIDVQAAFCDRLGITNLTDEAIIRLQMSRQGGQTAKTAVVKIYLRHGYGSGRTAGAEPNKLDRMLAEWEGIDVCLSGHTHNFTIAPPKPVAHIPNRGTLPERLEYRYRFAANPGCWLYSHLRGPGSYESMACYPARPMMTLKIVIWPFWSTTKDGRVTERPKVELRSYSIL